MKDFLITGVNSGLGKYLYSKLPNSLGLNRDNFDLIKDEEYQTIIHCAFNKENVITNYKKYLDDNIFLLQRLKNLKYKKFIYISTIDVYQKEQNMYSLFKKFSESLLDKEDLILRCSMMLGDTMKPNHLTKIKSNIPQISLSGDSTFNYILMDDLVEFFISQECLNYAGVVDFISNANVTLYEVKNTLSSNTELGDYTYESNLDFINPIFKLNNKYNKSSIENLTNYDRFL